MSYDYGKSFKKISDRFTFGGGNSSEVAIAQFYHSPADNKRVRKMPLVRGARTLLHLPYASSMLGDMGAWQERGGWGRHSPPLQSLPSQRLPWDMYLSYGQPEICSDVPEPDSLLSLFLPSTSLWMPSSLTSGSQLTSATRFRASRFPSEPQISSCMAGTPTSSWASTGLILKNR